MKIPQRLNMKTENHTLKCLISKHSILIICIQDKLNINIKAVFSIFYQKKPDQKFFKDAFRRFKGSKFGPGFQKLLKYS